MSLSLLHLSDNNEKNDDGDNDNAKLKSRLPNTIFLKASDLNLVVNGGKFLVR